MPRETPLVFALVSIGVFGVLLSFAWRQRTRAPQVLVGLLWFLGTLVPVSGIVQVGDATFANRYAYVPQVGIFIAVVWTADAWLREKGRLLAPALAAACVAVFSMLSARYVACWENTATLFTHAARVLPGSAKANGNAGLALARDGHLREALPFYRVALELSPHDPEIRGNLGVALSKLNDLEGAIAEFRRAAADEPEPDVAAFNLGTHLLRHGDAAAAIPVLESVIRSQPDDPIAHYWLGRACEAAARPEDATREYRLALARKPRDPSIQEALQRLARKD